MSLLASVAVGKTKDILGIALEASEHYITIELEDNTLHIFDAQGNFIRTYDSDQNGNESVVVGGRRLRKTFTLAASLLIIAKESTSIVAEDGIAKSKAFLEVVDAMTSTTITTIDLPEQPNAITSYTRREQSDLIVVTCSDDAHVQLTALSSTTLPPPDAAFSGVSTTTTAAAVADISPFKIWKHQIAHSILALLGVRDGVVQLWRLPNAAAHGEGDNTGIITNLGTIYATIEESLAESSTLLGSKFGNHKIDLHSGSVQVMNKVFSLLIHSSGRILTGHQNGQIKIWDCKTTQIDEVHGRKFSKPRHTVQNSPSAELVNGLLEYAHRDSSDANSTSIVVARDVDGFVRLWNFHDHDDDHDDPPDLIGQCKLFDHAVLRRVITKKGWLVAGGKEGITEDDSACGLNAQVKMLNLASLVTDSSHYTLPEIIELGSPSMAIWDIKIVDSLLEQDSEHVVVSLMRKGGAWLEVWKV